VIRAENVTKIFGSDPESAIPLLEENKTKDEIRELTGQTVGVNKASFDIQQGEVFAIMGLSGCGKSTLIRCINRIIDPTAGHIYFKHPDRGEVDITQLDEEALRTLRKQNMSMVFQHFALLPHRTVLSNVGYGMEIQGRGRRKRQEAAQRVLDMVGLGPWGRSYPSELSGGMQQRVGLARGLATDAEVLLMDEPFSALDPLIKVDMQQELTRIQRELHRTILFITHDLDEAMRIGDHIAIMEDGKIVQIGSPEQILVNPRTEYVAKFVEHADPTGVITAARSPCRWTATSSCPRVNATVSRIFTGRIFHTSVTEWTGRGACTTCRWTSRMCPCGASRKSSRTNLRVRRLRSGPASRSPAAKTQFCATSCAAVSIQPCRWP